MGPNNKKRKGRKEGRQKVRKGIRKERIKERRKIDNRPTDDPNLEVLRHDFKRGKFMCLRK